MAVKVVSLLLLGSLSGAEAASHSASIGTIRCPAHHCLARKATGTEKGSFECKQYQDEPHMCSIEAQTCNCTGTVQYGNGNEWAVPREVKGSISCSNDEFDGEPSGAKACWCTPTVSNWGGVSSTATVDPSCSGGVPNCVIVEGLTITVPGLEAIVADAMKGMALVAAGTFVDMPLDLYFKTKGTTTVNIDKTDVQLSKFTARVPCSTDLNKCVADLDALLSNTEPLRAITEKMIKADEKAFGNQAAMVAPMLVYSVPNDHPAPTEAQKAVCPALEASKSSRMTSLLTTLTLLMCSLFAASR